MDKRLVTSREVLFSIVIISVMLVFGFMISSGISNSLMNDDQEYNTALQIDNNKDVFQHGMRTNIGNAFVYGKLKAIDTVSYNEIEGDFSYIKKVKEKYTRHTRTVTKTRINSKGKTETYTETEEYYTWDYVSEESKSSTKIDFIGVEFPYDTIHLPNEREIKTIYIDGDWWHSSGDIRYVYYAAPAECKGTLYAVLKDNTISNVHFYYDKNIEDTIESLESEWQIIVFWIFWILLIGGLVVGFYVIDNKWLEDRKKERSEWHRK